MERKAIGRVKFGKLSAENSHQLYIKLAQKAVEEV